MANADLTAATNVSVSTGKWFAGWFTAFGILYAMAEIPEMADLAATVSITILIGTALFMTPTSAPVQGPDIGMTAQQIQAANDAARARIGG